MKKSKLSIKKLILMAICILIPLLSGYFIATYAYNRYQPYFFSEYMDLVEEDTEAKLEAYLDYYTYSYDKTPYYEQDVMKGDVKALTFRIYRAILTSQKLDNEQEFYTSYDLTYIFVIFDINYEKLIEIQDPTGETELHYNTLPTIYIRLEDTEYPTTYNDTLTMSIPQDAVLIKDYNSSPEEDSRGKAMNSRYLKWVEKQINVNYSDSIEVEVFMTDSLTEEEATYHSTILKVTKNDFYQTSSQLDFSAYTKGAESDVKAAGYLAHVIKTKVWWQSLIAVVLMGLISFSFYVVWNAEEAQNTQKKESKK